VRQVGRREVGGAAGVVITEVSAPNIPRIEFDERGDVIREVGLHADGRALFDETVAVAFFNEESGGADGVEGVDGVTGGTRSRSFGRVPVATDADASTHFHILQLGE